MSKIPPTPDQKSIIVEEIGKRRKEAENEGLCFTPPPEQEFSRDLSKPMVIWQAWTPTAAIGGTVACRVGFANPTSKQRPWLFAHVFVGPANIAVDLAPRGVGEALMSADLRFPRLTLPQFPGLVLDAGHIDTLSFSFKVPTNSERTNYLGNCFFFQSTWHDAGTYLDRSLFVFEVV